MSEESIDSDLLDPRTPDASPEPEETPLYQESSEDPEKEFFDKSLQYGQFYTRLVQGYINNQPLEAGPIDTPEQLRESRLIEELNSSLAYQAELFKTGEFTAKKLLAQISFPTDLIDSVEDGKDVLLEELSPGLYCVHVSMPAFKKLFGAERRAQAMAYKPRQDGMISFLIVEDFTGVDADTFKETYLKENVPHETHHVLEGLLSRKGVGVDELRETEKNRTKALHAYKDELTARLCSNGNLSGNRNLTLSEYEELAEENPENEAWIESQITELNNLLLLDRTGNVQSLLFQTGISSECLTGAVTEATTFTELKENILRLKSYLEKLPKLPETNAFKNRNRIMIDV